MMTFELELNSGWIYDAEDDDPIGETNFVVPYDFVKELYEKEFRDTKQYLDFDDFLDWYEPEDVGKYIYTKALADNKIIVDSYVCIYENTID